MKLLPTFMVIGAGKSGTTSLYEYLKAHPEIFMSEVKETNFFALKDQQIDTTDDDPEQMHHYPWSVTDFVSYLQLFEQAKNERALGEVSPMYLYHPQACQNIKAALPDVKLIAILRDPVDRLYSRYMHLARENREPSRRFDECLNRHSIWWRRNDLVKEGFYYEHLSRYFKSFGPDQLSVFLYEDLKNDPQRLMNEIYEFVGVDPSFTPNFSLEHNVSGRIKNKKLDKIIGQNSVVKSSIGKISPSLISQLKSSKKVNKWLLKWRKTNLSKPPLDANTRERIIKEIYSEDIIKLQSLINRDLSNWLTY